MPPIAPVAQSEHAQKRDRDGYNINVWIDGDIGRAFEHVIAGHRPRSSKTSHIEEAVLEYCKRLGFWPPKKNHG